MIKSCVNVTGRIPQESSSMVRVVLGMPVVLGMQGAR